MAKLAEHHVSGPMLRRMRDAAEAWKKALEDGRRGEFGLASEGLERAARLAGGLAAEALAASGRELSQRRDAASPRIERLYAALGTTHWPETLAAAEAVLELVPEHPAARQARIAPGSRSPPSTRRPACPAAPPRPSPPRGGRPRCRPRKAGIVFLDPDKDGDRDHAALARSSVPPCRRVAAARRGPTADSPANRARCAAGSCSGPT